MLKWINDTNRKWWVLLAMTSCLSMIFLNQTILSVILPPVQAELETTELGLLWVVNGYFLALTTLCLAGGRLGDIWGHRKLFCAGLILFAVSSMLCSVSLNSFWLIFSRVVQGIGGALLLPATGAILLSAFPAHERGKAMGLYVSISSIFLGLGPLIGGFFTHYLSWRFAFLINVPIAIFGFALALITVPASKKRAEKFDLRGFLLLGCATFCLVTAFMQGKSWGWITPLTVGLFTLGIALIVLDIFTARKMQSPLVDYKIFRNPIFSGAAFCAFCAQCLLMVTIFWALFTQNILHYTPLQAGWIALLSNVPVIVFAPLAGKLTDRFGPRLPLFIGFLLLVFSLGWVAFFCASQSLTFLFPALILFGSGIAMIFTPCSVTIMGQVPSHQKGIASAMGMFIRQLGSSWGMALFGGIFLYSQQKQFSFSLHQKPETTALDPSAFEGLLTHSSSALRELEKLAEPLAEWISQSYLQAYLQAFSQIHFLAAAIGIVGFACVISLRLSRAESSSQ